MPQDLADLLRLGDHGKNPHRRAASAAGHRSRFPASGALELLPSAMGRERGSAKLIISLRYPTVSTLSGPWKDAIRGYQPSVRWEKELVVEVTTLDELIREHGEPAFCKIDVEGFKEEALRGLSRPLRSLSFEFFPATAATTIACVKRVASLGRYRFNWSFTESFRFVSGTWLSAEEMIRCIAEHRGRRSGDVYAVQEP